MVAACGSTPSGPVVPVSPCVEVTFESTLITPEVIQFVGTVVITNQMRGPLEIQKVDYGADLHDQPFVDTTFAELHPMRSHGTQTVTLPIQVAMKDVAHQIEDVLAEESVRVTLHGTVFPIGFAPIVFSATKVVPIPRIPKVALDGARGSPLDGEFTVNLRVENTNVFPLSFRSIESFLNLNGKRYDLLESECFSDVPPGASGRIALTMRQTRGKGLSMLVNVVKNQSTDFVVGGSIQCMTPHGLFLVPIEVSSSATVSANR
jgi:LEA14-like dessication related protein